MPTSALTAALCGHVVGHQECSACSRVDLASFPCLAEPRDLQSQPDEGPAGPEVPSYATLAGSAPIANRCPGSTAADYELSRSRRGAKEVLPTSLKCTEPDRNYLTEAVIGSLPRGMSLGERASVKATAPLSSTLTRLGSLPSASLLSRGGEGQRQRRSVLRGAVLVYITAGYSGKRFVFERAKELGVRSVIIDGPDSWSRELLAEGVIERFIGLDMSDAETVFDRCLEAIQAVKHELGDLDGVLSFCEMAQPLVARLTERLGLPGNTPEAVDAARDKHATRVVMAEAGLPTPRNYLITSARDLEQASNHVGYPAVIKPICGAASIGVVRVDDFPHLQHEYGKVVREMAAARVIAGALQQGDTDESSGEEGPGESASGSSSDHCCGSDGAVGAASGGSEACNNEEGHPAAAGSAATTWIKTTIMMEEYLDGPEVDVDLVFSEGQPVFGGVNDNDPTVEPYFNETGSNGPSVLPRHQQRELMDLAVKSVQALGFESGVFHVELKYTARGARIIEVNCRMGGGCVRLMNLLVWGVDLVEEQLLCSAGIPSRPNVAPAPLANVAEYSVNAKRTGLLRDFAFLDKWQGHPDVIYARAMVPPGSKVVCAEDGLPTWVCELMCTKPKIEEAIAFAAEMEADMQATMVIDSLPRQHH